MGNSLGKAEVQADKDVQGFDLFIQRRWKDDNTNFGRDARGLRHSEIKVTKVTKFVNSKTLDRYKKTKKHFMARYQKGKNVFMVPKVVKSHLEPVLKRDFLPAGEPRLDGSINEVWLFHGTNLANIAGIEQAGFDYGKASEDGLYGKWIYLTDSPQKADQYTGQYYYTKETIIHVNSEKTNKTISPPSGHYLYSEACCKDRLYIKCIPPVYKDHLPIKITFYRSPRVYFPRC